jgi:hypothetical protein
MQREETPMPDQFTKPSARGTSPGRILAIVAGATAALLATGMLAAGGLLLWADGKKDDAGYLSTASKPFSTSTYAIATDSLDIDSGASSVITSQDEYGKVRLKVTPHGDAPVFVGIAPTDAVSSYLDRSAHATLTDIDVDPFRATYQPHGGAAQPAPPTGQHIWAASTHGTGRQTLTWDVKHGNWSIVVMNADGSAGVDVGVSAGANVPVLDWIGWVALGGGLVLLIAAGGLMFVGLRPRGPRANADSGLVPVAA